MVTKQFEVEYDKVVYPIEVEKSSVESSEAEIIVEKFGTPMTTEEVNQASLWIAGDHDPEVINFLNLMKSELGFTTVAGGERYSLG